MRQPDPDAQIKCEVELEDGFLALADQAVANGHDRTLAAKALKSLATNHLMGLAANVETKAAIARLSFQARKN